MVDQLVSKVRTGKRQSLKASRLAFGSLMTKKWRTSTDPDITRINSDVMAGVLRLYHENFTEINDRMFTMYCRFFSETCYAFLDRGKVVGYCVFFVKPVFSYSHIYKTATLYSLAVDSEYRGHGIGERLLRKGIREMKLNSVSCISLYVSTENMPAIRLYRNLGFRILRELDDVCGPGLKCYEMDMKPGQNPV
ncbi:GNAT family N-acetyltransferase [Methanolobus chelungpuianus]|uniref:GNAT family N-acetyltransferase n=1 Tax=Methanolobus chelungpuianus TaxID=502115 RepID=UPI0021147CE0|nr:GNAT family N-acetyltransferase [Methanolobus chelungpuianus]